MRALIFAIAALERTPRGEMSLRDYLMTRRELHTRLGRELGPSDGGRFSSNAPARLNVHVSRNLRDRVVRLLPRKDPAELDLVVERALHAGVSIVEREDRHRRAWKRRARARAQRKRGAARPGAALAAEPLHEHPVAFSSASTRSTAHRNTSEV